MAINVGETEVSSLIAIGQLPVVNAEQVQNGCVQVVHVTLMIHRVKTKFIGLDDEKKAGAKTSAASEAVTVES